MSCGNAGLVTSENAYTPVGAGDPDLDVTLTGAQTITGIKTFTGNMTYVGGFANPNYFPTNNQYTSVRSSGGRTFTTFTGAIITIPDAVSTTPCATLALSTGGFPATSVFIDFSGEILASSGTLNEYTIEVTLTASDGTVYTLYYLTTPGNLGQVSAFCGLYYAPLGNFTIRVYAYASTSGGASISVFPGRLNVILQPYSQ